MTRERALILVALLAIVAALAWTAWPHEPTAAERVDRITSELRCVTCQGLSVKDSPAASARQMRDLVVQRVAEEHDGTARATNAEDGGAVVSLELPQVDQVETEPT